MQKEGHSKVKWENFHLLILQDHAESLSCIPQWVLKVLLQNVENNDEKLAIVLFHQEVSKLSALSSDINLKTISEEEMVCCLLEIESDLCITFDTAINKLIDVSLLDI